MSRKGLPHLVREGPEDGRQVESRVLFDEHLREGSWKGPGRVLEGSWKGPGRVLEEARELLAGADKVEGHRRRRGSWCEAAVAAEVAVAAEAAAVEA